MNEYPAWQELPEQVRKRVTERFEALFPKQSDEDWRGKLDDLSVYRLVRHFDGDFAQAIAFAKSEDGGRALLKKIGKSESDWRKACARCEETIKQIDTDEEKLRQTIAMRQLVFEELEIYRSRN